MTNVRRNYFTGGDRYSGSPSLGLALQVNNIVEKLKEEIKEGWLVEAS
jgi:hypothetical protein